LKPSGRLLLAFLFVVLVPSALLAWSTWRLMEQDFALDAQARQARREQTADIAVSALRQKFDELARRLEQSTDSTLSVAAGATSVIFTEGRVATTAPLLFYPDTKAGPEASEAEFEGGERLEYAEQNAAEAARWFRARRASATPAVRAGMLMRESRNLRRLSHSDEALAVLRELAAVPQVAIAGIPADLMARWATADLLEQQGRSQELQETAAALRRDLLTGRWHLSREVFETHWEDTSRWLGRADVSSDSRLLNETGAIGRLWDEWQRRGPDAPQSSGIEVLPDTGGDGLLMWHADRKRLAAVVASPEYVEREWRFPVARLLAPHDVNLTLERLSAPRGANQTRRSGSETGLPFTVAITAASVADAGRSAWFNRWIAGAGVLLLIVAMAATVIVRAAGREFAVARLQADFVAAVSHEFRTPLTSLRQVAEVLHDGRVAPERQAFHYLALVRHTDRLTRLVETLLDFGRMEAGTSPYRKERLAVGPWILSLVEEFNQTIMDRGYRVALRGIPDGLVEGDRDALTNALWNLLDNAVKYSPEHRHVFVDTGRSGAMMAIRVRDHGIGIPEREQREIFRKFVRGAEAKHRNIAGTGIGLAMVAHVARAHGGTVHVESAPGMGSTFTLLIPCLES